MLRELMKRTPGGSFLNLFAYTGTASCYAADGGAGLTTTVDLSRPSLDWARRNMERNGFVGRNHEFIQADVLQWVADRRHEHRYTWDLIFCDVPTFSNSNRMHASSWDVQRDHADLIISVSRLLSRGGCAIFSCNLRSFKPDIETLEKAGVELVDITAKTISEDFSRNPKLRPRVPGDAPGGWRHGTRARPLGAASSEKAGNLAREPAFFARRVFSTMPSGRSRGCRGPSRQAWAHPRRPCGRSRSAARSRAP